MFRGHKSETSIFSIIASVSPVGALRDHHCTNRHVRSLRQKRTAEARRVFPTSNALVSQFSCGRFCEHDPLLGTSNNKPDLQLSRRSQRHQHFGHRDYPLPNIWAASTRNPSGKATARNFWRTPSDTRRLGRHGICFWCDRTAQNQPLAEERTIGSCRSVLS